MTSARWSKPRPNASPASGPRIARLTTIQTVVSEPEMARGHLTSSVPVSGFPGGRYETQRRVVSGKTGIYPSASPGKSTCVPIDPGGEIVTPLALFLYDVFYEERT